MSAHKSQFATPAVAVQRYLHCAFAFIYTLDVEKLIAVGYTKSYFSKEAKHQAYSNLNTHVSRNRLRTKPILQSGPKVGIQYIVHSI